MIEQYQRGKKGRICLTKVCSWNDNNIKKAMVFLDGELEIENGKPISNKIKNENVNEKKPDTFLKRFFHNQFKKMLVYMYAKRQKNYD